MSNIHEMGFLKEKVDELKQAGLYKEVVTLDGPNEAECSINGKMAINLSSNNYLGFSNHPRLKKAAIEAIEKYGALKGSYLAIKRILRCHPFYKGNLNDPVE